MRDPDRDAYKRLYVAILLQAYRDFCNGDSTEMASSARWVFTEGFSFTCEMADVSEEKARETFATLAKYRPEIRKKLLREMTRAALGIESPKKDRPRP